MKACFFECSRYQWWQLNPPPQYCYLQISAPMIDRYFHCEMELGFDYCRSYCLWWSSHLTLLIDSLHLAKSVSFLLRENATKMRIFFCLWVRIILFCQLLFESLQISPISFLVFLCSFLILLHCSSSAFSLLYLHVWIPYRLRYFDKIC